MSLNIQPRVPQYRNLAPLVKANSVQLNQLPSIGSVFPEFFKQRTQYIPSSRSIYRHNDTSKIIYRQSDATKPIFRRIVANTTNQSTDLATQSPVCQKSVNYSMPFLYSMHGKLRSRIQTKSFLPRRKRVTTFQSQVLNEEFERNPFPNVEERYNISEKLGISAKSIQIWFQNKRQAVRSISHQ